MHEHWHKKSHIIWQPVCALTKPIRWWSTITSKSLGVRKYHDITLCLIVYLCTLCKNIGRGRWPEKESQRRDHIKKQSQLTCLPPKKVGFHTAEHIGTVYCFLFVTSQFVKNRTIENKSSISLGRTTILLALFAQKIFFGQIHFESILSHIRSHQNRLYTTKNGKPENNKQESCVIYLFSIYCVKIVTFSNSKSNITLPFI